MCLSKSDETRDYGRLWPPEGDRYTQIDAADNYTCGLRVHGTANCWGDTSDAHDFLQHGETYINIAADSAGACGLRGDGSYKCSSGETVASAISAPAEGAYRLQDLESGGLHTCGLTAEGEPICWGGNGSGEASPPDDRKFTLLTLNNGYTCGLEKDTGELVCWGADLDFGQPIPPAGLSLETIRGGTQHVCGLRKDGAAVCWGLEPAEDDGSIASINYGQANPPEGERFKEISCGESHTCGLRTDGTLLCWGKGYLR